MYVMSVASIILLRKQSGHKSKRENFSLALNYLETCCSVDHTLSHSLLLYGMTDSAHYITIGTSDISK